MKRLLSAIIAILFSFSAFSQGNNCNTSTAFCSPGPAITYPAGVATGTAEPGPNYGCLGSEPNPAWFFMQIANPGTMSIAITSSPPRDIDFILYGPFTSSTAPCTAQLTAANTEDCSYAGGTAPEYADITGAVTGEYYILLLTNFSNAATNITFQAQPGSTATTNCAVLCDISSLTAVPTTCSPATNTYSVAGQIAFTAQPTTGTLTVTSSCGGSQVFNAPFASPINYNIAGITANGAACSVTATFSATPSCTQSTTYSAPANCTPCTATANNSGPVCSGSNLNLTAGTVTGATSYSWTGPGGFTSSVQNPVRPGVSVAASGTYTVTVTTASATCTATTTALVNPTPAAPAVTNNGPLCSGSTLNLSTTVTGVTYNWTGPATFSSTVQNPTITPVTNAATGTYSLTVTSNGCTSVAGTTSVVINNTPNAPIPKVNTLVSDTVCAGASVTLTSNLIAGATYSWTGPNSYTAAVRNPPVITGATPLMSGTYSLTVTVGGCTSLPATVNLLVNPIPPAPTVNGASICSGATATLSATAPGDVYNWYDAATGGTLIFTGNPFTTPSLTDTITYYVQSTINGCTGPRTSVTVNVSPSFTVNTIPDDSICSGASFTLGVESPTGGGYTYSWDSPTAVGFSTSSTPSVSPAGTLTYSVTLTDAIGCTDSDTIRITVGTLLVLDASGSPANCSDTCDGSGSAIISGSFAPYVYDWSNGTTLSTVGSLCAGTYTVIVTDFIGCVIQDTIMIDEPSQITLTTSTVSAHCSLPDGSATVTAAGGVPPYTYFWSPVGVINSTATGLIPDVYCVTVTDSHGCSIDTCVTVANIPGVTATASVTPTDCYASCNGTASVTASSGTLPYLYSWSSGQTTASISGLCAGIYTCIVTDSASCTDSVTVTVNQPAAVQVDPIAPPADICIGQSSTLTATATGGTPGYTFTWTPAYTGNPYTVSPASTTPYSVTATDALGCASTNTQTVIVNVKPPLSGFATTSAVDICIGKSTTLSAFGSGGDGTYTYSWMPGPLTGSPVTVSPLINTTYTVTISDGCTTLSATSTMMINVQPKPVPNFRIDPYITCVPTCVNFTDLSTIPLPGTTTPTWSVDGVIIGSTANFCFTAGGTHTVSLLETSNNGCKDSISKVDSITVYDMPVADFSFDPQPASVNFPTISFTDASSFASSWSWNFADSIYSPASNTSNLPNPQHNYLEAGTYCVDLIVTNTLACADTVENCLVIDPDYTFYIPNTFTPNNNGLNDEFYPIGLHVDTYEMQIYDRWGNLVFRTTDLEEHWKGNVKGSKEIAQEDVYVYIINVKDLVGERHQYIGHITIVK